MIWAVAASVAHFVKRLTKYTLFPAEMARPCSNPGVRVNNSRGYC
jgi:hypothetical protein